MGSLSKITPIYKSVLCYSPLRLGLFSKAKLLPGPKVIKLCSCSTQLSMKFIMLINAKMPTSVGILTFKSMINTTSER